MNLFEAIQGRRSVRKYSDESIDEEDLRQILEAGRMAPSWNNTQCWEVVLVRDQKKKAALSLTLPDKNPAKKAVDKAPLVLVACGQKGKSGLIKNEVSTKLGDWMMFDVALFLHNVTLAAHALGYGTVHVGWFDHDRVAEILGVPNDFQVVELIPIGCPAETPKAAFSRREISDFVHHETY